MLLFNTSAIITKPENMQIAIIGYGKMGREIEAIASKRGHQVILKIDENSLHLLKPDSLAKADVAIEFSTPGTAWDNIISCFNAGVPVVCGTTGWTDRLAEITDMCRTEKHAFFYASNFSIGVNILFRINRWLAGVMNNFPGFNVGINEIHHIHKKDSPSGTALTLAGDILEGLSRKTSWKNSPSEDSEVLEIISERTAEVPGTHVVTYTSATEILELGHRALDRSVFAEGALMAAEFLVGKTGFFKMDDLLEF
jgi:4-hydroxy-tetrahydrodipicolinate reductase